MSGVTVPIVPGPQPDEPKWQDLTPPLYEPYRPPQQPIPAPPPTDTQATVKKAAVGTVTVIAVLVGIFCVLPVVACFVFGIIGQIGAGVTGSR